MLFNLGVRDLFLNEDEPHLEQTILPPNDLSETISELPQFKQILLEFIYEFKFISFFINYIHKSKCKEKHQIKL